MLTIQVVTAQKKVTKIFYSPDTTNAVNIHKNI